MIDFIKKTHSDNKGLPSWTRVMSTLVILNILFVYLMDNAFAAWRGNAYVDFGVNGVALIGAFLVGKGHQKHLETKTSNTSEQKE